MKRILSLLLATATLVSLCACSSPKNDPEPTTAEQSTAQQTTAPIQADYTQEEIRAVSELIDAIGEVGYTSLSAINRAEHAYAALSDSQKAALTNAANLTAAREAYDALVSVPKRGTKFDRNVLHTGVYRFRKDLWNDEGMQKLVDAGVDVILSGSTDPTLLDLCQEYGVGVFAHANLPGWPRGVGENAEQFDSLVEKYQKAAESFVDHPVLWALSTCDEPVTQDFEYLGILTKYTEANFPAGLAYINLFPQYASASQLGVNSYEKHIEEYVKYVDTDYISYDHYPYATNTLPLFCDNLQIVADACRENGKDLWIVMELSSTERLLNRGEISVQAYSALCYGARMLNWACWTYGWFEPDYQIVDSKGNYTVMYDYFSSVNAEIAKFSDEYMGYTSVETFAIGNDNEYVSNAHAVTLNGGIQNVFCDLALTDNGSGLVGYFEKSDGSSYGLMVANATDIYGSQGSNVLTFRVPFAKSVYATVDGVKTELTANENGYYSVSIPNCGGSFITVTRDESAFFRAEVARGTAEDTSVDIDLSAIAVGADISAYTASPEGLAELGLEFVIASSDYPFAQALKNAGIALLTTPTSYLGNPFAKSNMAYGPYTFEAFYHTIDSVSDSSALYIFNGEKIDMSSLPRDVVSPFAGVYLDTSDKEFQDLISAAATSFSKAGKDWWAYFGTPGKLSAKQLSWQVWAALAFNAKKVILSDYSEIASDSTLRTALKDTISEVKNISPLLGNYKYVRTYALTDSQKSISDVKFVSDISTDDSAIFGLYGNDSGAAIMVLPGDPDANSNVTVHFTLDGTEAEVTAYVGGEARELTKTGDGYSITLSGPDAVLITVK